jgi:hypothetical protein
MVAHFFLLRFFALAALPLATLASTCSFGTAINRLANESNACQPFGFGASDILSLLFESHESSVILSRQDAVFQPLADDALHHGMKAS